MTKNDKKSSFWEFFVFSEKKENFETVCGGIADETIIAAEYKMLHWFT